MKNKYDFILDNMKYSYSSVNSYLTCPGCFMLNYIMAEDGVNNAFSDFGNLVHLINEKFFKGELTIPEMVTFYEENFEDAIKNEFPPYPKGMKENYYNSGLAFYENFKFDKDLYEIIFIEDYINANFKNFKFVVKPDLVLMEKSTQKYILVDYKTAKMKLGKKYKGQIEEYKRQLLLYVFFLWNVKEIEIKEIYIWFIRDGHKEKIIVNPIEIQSIIEWMEKNIILIKNETEWNFNNSKENEYFCNNLCSFRNICPSK